MAPQGGISFYIGLYREIHLKFFFSSTNNPNVKEIHLQHPLDIVCKVCKLKKIVAQKEATIGEILGI